MLPAIFHIFLFQGHFTQLIWKGSEKLGVGVATSASGKVYVVARYHPAGNYPNQFTENVFPASSTEPVQPVQPPVEPTTVAISNPGI